MLRDCQLCDNGTLADYDAKTVFGAWAYLCHSCYLAYGYGEQFRTILADIDN